MHFCSLSLYFVAALAAFAPHVPTATAADRDNECVIQAVHALPINPNDEASTEQADLQNIDFLCDVGSQSLHILLSDGQKKTMIEKLESGELVGSVSTLSLAALGASIDVDSGSIRVTPEANVASALGSGDVVNAQAASTGDKHTLVVRVTDSKGRVVPRCAAQVGDDIFGTRGDPVNLRTQMYLCSYGQTRFIAGDPPTNSAGNHEVAAGVIEVTINKDLNAVANRYEVENAVTAAVQAKLGFNLPGPYEHVMYVLEKCYKDCGWAAYARVNGWLSVYQGGYSTQTGVLVHELGHNFNLAHSGQGTAGYNDHTCMMGNPLYSDDVGKMCFNGAKSWQLGWYDTNTHTFKPTDGAWLGKIVGVADFKNNPHNSPVVVKLETNTSNDYFVTFNRATGCNSQNDEADNQVTVVQTGANGEGYSQSWLKAKLSRGKSYSISNFAGTGKTLKVIVRNIVYSGCTSYADVDICLDGNCSPTASPTKAPTPSPPSCVSGEAALLTSSSASDGPSIGRPSLTKVKDIKIGDTVRGYDSDLSPTTCKVEAIGSFGVGAVYGNYTADHYVFNPYFGTIEQHGMTGPESWEEKFDLISDCPLIEDEVGKRFAPIDSDFCGGEMKDMSWSDYLLLHRSILNIVRESGAFWFQGSSYSDMTKVQKLAPKVCKNMVKCMKNNKNCKQLEKASQRFINNVLTKSAKLRARKSFSRIGSPCEVGSVSAIVTSGKTVDASLVGTEAC